MPRAIVDYTKAIELKPDYASAYSNRGEAYVKRAIMETPSQTMTKAIELEPL